MEEPAGKKEMASSVNVLKASVVNAVKTMLTSVRRVHVEMEARV